ncbi:hypothetical protein [Streptomyces sp. VRA16 Mangrove soil]|uniref:ATP-binding protein n=1 Tax=Streptomyces sp. VRA16 Mangrove soil TaxID=2817434 RepID=UPI001A9F07BB|nr:hypothetical protein [Streptomyces sp. VRA16 Mangrove soil]MBO1336932.1 hypothetical protein [Streptomyces sp. VRA16 Mangrove soil]
MEGLPVETTEFIGRTTEIAFLDQELADQRLLTLTGVGGVGKTRLAVQLARRAGPDVADVVCFVPLSPLRDPALLGNVLLEELRLADQSLDPAEDVVARWLADKRALLVLDTCEHLVEGCARLVAKLLAAAPELRVLATSRQALGLDEERCFEVAPLPVEPARRDGRPGDAVALFADRAATATGTFRLGPAERVVAEAVCRHLDGIPLAVELAAARLAELPLERLGSLLIDRFDALCAQGDDHAVRTPRHRALRTTIGWSHELCTPLERLLWARLSVFIGGFDLEGALAVGGSPLSGAELPAVLDSLVAKSLVRRMPGEGGRYAMLDTVREFGAHWLRALGEEDAVRCLHRDHYRALARRADAAWMSPAQTTWHARLLAEHANFRTALDFCLKRGEGRLAQELCGNLWILWFACGFTREGRHYTEAALSLAPGCGPEHTSALWACSLTAVGQGDAARTAELASRITEAIGQDGSLGVRAAAAYAHGSALTLSGRIPEAIAAYDTAVDTAADTSRRSGPYQEAWFMLTVGRSFTHVMHGELTTAATMARKVVAECERRGDLWIRSWADYVSALAELSHGRPYEAARHARAAITSKARFRDTIGLAMALDALTTATCLAGDGPHAARLQGIAQQHWQVTGRPQLGMPELIETSRRAERQLRAALGDLVYEEQYAAGLHMPAAEGIAYALGGTG